MKLCIRCKGGGAYGWGHLVRSLRLATYIRKNYSDSSVDIIAETLGNTEPLRRNWDGGWIEVPGGWSIEEEAKTLESVRSDVSIIDMLEIPRSLLRLYRTNSARLVAFNDLALEYVEPDFLICPQVLKSYPEPEKGQTWLTGLDYFLLEDSLSDPGAELPVQEKAKSMLVILGGGLAPEVKDWLFLLLDELRKKPFKTMVVMGFQQGEALDLVERYSGSSVEFIRQTENLGPLMQAADLAIAASGYVKMELAAVGTPALLVSIVDHQEELGRFFAEATGAARYIGKIQDVSSSRMIAEIDRLCADFKSRSFMSKAGRRAVDGQGARRIAERILAADRSQDREIHNNTSPTQEKK